MPISLADGHTRVALLNQKPADPLHPTVQELNNGIDASCRILSSDYNVTPTASETVDEKPLCVEGNAQAFGASNATIEFTPFRYFADDGTAEPTEADQIGDAVFQATKVKGTRLWIYHRETSKMSTDPWEEGDEVDGFEFLTDNPQQVDRSGYVKRKIVGAYQDMWLNGTVTAASGGSGG